MPMKCINTRGACKIPLETKFDDFGDGENLLQIDILPRVGNLQKVFSQRQKREFWPKSEFCKHLTILACFIFTACGFHLAPSLSKNEATTINVPYVQGDHSGKLTAALVEEIEKHTKYCYVKNNGTVTLQVKLLDTRNENIGFRFDRHSPGSEKLIPNESRTKRLAEVTLIDTGTQKVLLGPVYILATNDYDHQNYSLNTDINRFSLGQLSDIDTTDDVLYIPADRTLAQEIANWLTHSPSQAQESE